MSFSGTAFAAEEPWAVVGLRASAAQSMREPVESLRRLLAADGRAGPVLEEDETKARLGLETVDLESIQRRIDGAELYWFQLELASARENLEQALRALTPHVGARAADRDRLTRLLLAEIHLAEGGPDAEARAARALVPIARLRSEDAPDPRAYSPELVALFDEVRDEAGRAPVGWLRVECEPACPGNQVWIDSHPSGPPGARIELPAGRYRVAVGDRGDETGARSLVREIALEGGDELAIRIDLSLEIAADAADGPSFPLRGRPVRETASRFAGARLPLPRLVILWMESDERSTTSSAMLVEPATGRIVREVSATGADVRDALVHLASLLLDSDAAPVASSGDGRDGEGPGGAAAQPAGAADSGALAHGERRSADAKAGSRAEAKVVAQRLVAADPEASPAWVAPTRWAAVGLGAAAATAGIWLRLDAASRESELLDSARSGSFRSAADGRAATREASSIRSQADVGTGLLVGAGAAAVTAAVLFLMD